MTNNKIRFILLPLMIVMLALGISVASAQVDPPQVEADLISGETLEVEKTVTTPAIPPRVDICLLEDETGSFGDDIHNLKTAAPGLYDTIVATSPDAQFAVAGFRDYPVPPHGGADDWVYRLLSGMNSTKAAWTTGVNALTAGGGADGPEAQYDAIVAAAGPGTFNDPTRGDQDNCGWRADATVQRVLVVATDAPFHLPGSGKPHVNTLATTTAALDAQRIILIGLKASGAGGELDALATATGGSVQPLDDDGENIAMAILAALQEIKTDVWWDVTCDPDLPVTLDPAVYYDVPGETTLDFLETITAGLDLGLHECTVIFTANDYPEEGAEIGRQKILIDVKPLPVDLDIHPGSCPNPLNVDKKGVTPVAIAGTEDFDVTQVDPDTLLLKKAAEDGFGVSPLRWAYEDAVIPYDLEKEWDRYSCLEYYEGDGFLDLTLKFRTQAIALLLGEVEDGDELLLHLTGNLYDGTPIAGEDVVWIRAKK